MMLRLVFAAFLALLWPVLASAQNHGPLQATAVTVAGTAVVAVSGPVQGCNISSSVALIIDQVGTAGTSASGTSQLQPAGAAPYQCGRVAQNAKVSVNCSGGGTCSWTGDVW
jgi:hypothetical protein